jgi:hypothetical protein
MLRQVSEKQAEIHDADGKPDCLPLCKAGTQALLSYSEKPVKRAIRR